MNFLRKLIAALPVLDLAAFSNILQYYKIHKLELTYHIIRPFYTGSAYMGIYICNFKGGGLVAQLEEHFAGYEEVVGSSPIQIIFLDLIFSTYFRTNK